MQATAPVQSRNDILLLRFRVHVDANPHKHIVISNRSRRKINSNIYWRQLFMKKLWILKLGIYLWGTYKLEIIHPGTRLHIYVCSLGTQGGVPACVRHSFRIKKLIDFRAGKFMAPDNVIQFSHSDTSDNNMAMREPRVEPSGMDTIAHCFITFDSSSTSRFSLCWSSSFAAHNMEMVIGRNYTRCTADND